MLIPVSSGPIGAGTPPPPEPATSTQATVTAGTSGTYKGYRSATFDPSNNYGSIANGPLLSTGTTFAVLQNVPNASIVVVSLLFSGDQVDAINDNFLKLTFEGDDYLLADALIQYNSGGANPYTVVEWVFFGGSYTGTVMADGLSYDFQLV